MMDTFYQTKLNELVTEFSRYLIENPDFGEQIPHGSQVVLLEQRDPLYSQQAVEYAAQAKEKLVFSPRKRAPVIGLLHHWC